MWDDYFPRYLSSKAIHDANQAKTIEGVLAALLGVSLIALFALLFLFLRLRKRYRSARSQLALHQSAQGGHRQGGAGGLQGVMSEKPGESVSQYSPQGGLLTPRAGGRNGDHLRNPFDDASAIVSGHQGGGGARSPLLGSVLGEGGRQSVTSLVSAVPSHGARSTAADSAISTEFYHTYKASTIPPRDPNDPSSASGPFGGMMRSLFAPMSFFSSATPSPNPSTSTRSVSVTARSTGREGETSSLNTDYYGDRNSVTRPETTRSGDSSETIHDAVTRVSTRSGGTAYSTSDADTHSHLAPSSASRQSRQSSMTTSNGADVSSVAQHDDDDTYSDTDDAASFSNFSYIDTGRLGFSSSSEDVHADNRRGGSSEEGSTTVVEPPRNPFREPSPDESLNKRRSWNRPYAALDREFLDSTQSFDSK